MCHANILSEPVDKGGPQEIRKTSLGVETYRFVIRNVEKSLEEKQTMRVGGVGGGGGETNSKEKRTRRGKSTVENCGSDRVRFRGKLRYRRPSSLLLAV